MTRALYFLAEGSLIDAAAGAQVVLQGPEGHHAVDVKRARVADELLFADGSGRRGRGRVDAVEPGRLTATLLEVTHEGPAGPRFVLVQALAKNGRDEQAVETATELGVDGVLAWQAQRSIVQWRGERGRKSLGKWVNLVRSAAKQARRADIPSVEGPSDSTAVADAVRSAVAAGGAALVLHEEADTRLDEVVIPPDEVTVLLVVGPEGGITPAELDAFTRAGAQAVRLGPTVLRASTAGPAALSVLLAAGRWRHQD